MALVAADKQQSPCMAAVIQDKLPAAVDTFVMDIAVVVVAVDTFNEWVRLR